jgi:mercuric ion transport protein
MTHSTNINKTWVSGLIAAFAASLCCIAPLIAVLGGISGIASAFSWIEPFRPYLTGFTVVVFSFAWYQQLRKKAVTAENCECNEKPEPFLKSQKFLLAVTLLSAVLIAFPYYSSGLYGAPKQSSAASIQQGNLKLVQLTVKGMGCADCTRHIDGTLSKVAGVVNVNTSFEKAQTTVSYDPLKTSADSLKSKINEIGYHVTAVQIKSK